MVHIDSLEVVKALQANHLENSPLALVKRIHLCLQNVEQWCFKHILRDENKVADRLAKMASDRDIEVQVLDKVLEELCDEFVIDVVVDEFGIDGLIDAI